MHPSVWKVEPLALSQLFPTAKFPECLRSIEISKLSTERFRASEIVVGGH